jgi:hypothetical protein
MLIRFMKGSPKFFRKGLFWLGFMALAGMLILNSCTKANIVLGQNQIDLNFSNIVQIDTLTPVMSTLFMDSIASSGTGISYVGGYNDAYFGRIHARSYFEIAPPALSTIDPQAGFDSMTLYMIPNRYYYGDTSVPMDIYAYQIAQPLQFNYTYQDLPGTSFYSDDSVAVLPTPIGHVQRLISPANPDTVYIPLDPALGNQFFNDYRAQIVDMGNPSDFVKYFAGIQLSTGLNNTSVGNIVGFKDTCVVKIWYHLPDANRSQETLSFKYSNKAFQFNEIRNTPIAPLNKFTHAYSSVQQIYSTDSGFAHQTYVNQLLGYNTKIEFPYLRGIYQDTAFVKIQRALLILRPIQASYNQFLFPLPVQLQLASTNYFNLPGSSVSTGALTLDYLGGNTYYTFDITSYLTEELTNLVAQTNKDGLIIEPTGASATEFNRVIFGDKNYQSPFNSTNYIQAQIVLYYLGVKSTL